MPNAKAQTSLALDSDDSPAVILLGRDDANKAHASWFGQEELEAATAAAAAMGMMTLAVNSEELSELASRLPHGKIFGSGKAFVPFTKQTLFDELIGHVPLAQQIRPLKIVRASAEAGGSGPEGGDKPKPSAASKAPSYAIGTDWGALVAGNVVLAWSGEEEGWWEAVVVDPELAGYLTLRWRDYPAEPHFKRPVRRIALLHPSLQPLD